MSQCHKKHLVSLRRGSKRGPSPAVDRVRGRSTRSAGGGQQTTLGALSPYSGGGGDADAEGCGRHGAKTGAALVMTASTTPLIQSPMMGAGDAAAEPGRKDGQLYCVAASTTTTVLEATSRSSPLIQYSNDWSSSSCAASSTTTAWGSGGGWGCGCSAGAPRRASGGGPLMVRRSCVEGCGRGGAEREPRQNVLVMSKKNTNLKAFK